MNPQQYYDTSSTLTTPQAEDEVSKLKLSELREELEARGLDITGLKSILVERLRKALEDEKKDYELKVGASVVKLFVGQIPAQTTEEELRKLFAPYGEVKEALILKDRMTDKPKGCGFVTYATKAEADKACETLNDKIKLPGAKRELIVRPAGLRPEEEGKEYKLYVGMLSRKSGEEDIRKLFEPYGVVMEIYLMKDGSSQSKGAAFIKFPTRDEALRAIQALNGRFRDKDAPGMLQVRFAHTKEEKVQQQRMAAALNPFQAFNPYASATPSFFPTSTTSADFGFGGQSVNPYASLYAAWSQHTEHTNNPDSQQQSQGQTTSGPPGSNVFIYNLPDSYDDNDLASLFSNFGMVVSTKVQRDKITGASRGFGFVSFDNQKSAAAAIAALDNFMIGSKRLNVRLKRGEPAGSSGGPASTGYAPY